MASQEWTADRTPVVILTAVGLEYRAVRAHLIAPVVREHPRHTLFEVGRVRGTSWRAAIAETGVGNRSAAVITDRAIDMFGPTAIFFVGIAGALRRDIGLGDVVVGTRIYDYQGGTDTGAGFLGRPRAWDAPYNLDQLARRVARIGRWTTLLGPVVSGVSPRVHFGPIAAGEVVLNSRSTAIAQQLRRNFNDAAAVEMESAGAAYAAHLNRTRILTVRGISDHADARKTAADRHGTQPAAAHHAAAFAVALICCLPSPSYNVGSPGLAA